MAFGLPKDPEGQKKFLMGALPIIALVGYYQFWHTSKVVPPIEALETRFEELDTKNQSARAQASPQQMQMLQQKLSLYENHIKRMEELIPQREQEAELLNQMTARARDSGLEIALFKPVTEEPGQFYNKRIYDMRVVGTFHAIGRYFAQIGSLPRIVNASDVRVIKETTQPQNRPSGLRLVANFKINTFVIPPPPSDTAKAPPPPAGTTPPTTTNAGN